MNEMSCTSNDDRSRWQQHDVLLSPFRFTSSPLSPFSSITIESTLKKISPYCGARNVCWEEQRNQHIETIMMSRPLWPAIDDYSPSLPLSLCAYFVACDCSEGVCKADRRKLHSKLSSKEALPFCLLFFYFSVNVVLFPCLTTSWLLLFPMPTTRRDGLLVLQLRSLLLFLFSQRF